MAIPDDEPTDRQADNSHPDITSTRYTSISHIDLHALPLATAVLDATGRILRCNDRWCELFGLGLAQLYRVPLHEVLIEPDPETLTQRLAHAIAGQTTLSCSVAIKSTDRGRSTGLLSLRGTRIDDRARVVVTLLELPEQIDPGAAVERERIEKTRHHVERLMRHDLRNPIDGIYTATGFLLSEDLDPRQLQFIQLIRDAAIRARNHIDGASAYGAMEAGTYHVEYARLNVVQLLRDVRIHLAGLIAAKRAELYVRAADEPLEERFDMELWGDADLITDAIENLVRNALEAADPDERVQMRANESVVDGVAIVTIEIRNRADVPTAVRAKFFDPYMTFGKPRGTGLGTFLSRLVVEAHGGRARMQTANGDGTCVALEFPRGRPGQARSLPT